MPKRFILASWQRYPKVKEGGKPLLFYEEGIGELKKESNNTILQVLRPYSTSQRMMVEDHVSEEVLNLTKMVKNS